MQPSLVKKTLWERTGRKSIKKSRKFFMKCEDLADAHKMAAMVFGLEKPFHIAADSIRETDSINKGVYEENPFWWS